MSTFQPQPQQLPQPQNQPQQQQPVVVYPNPLTNPPVPGSASHHPNGSFGTVFIILAVIVVVSAIACFLGRLCNRRVIHNEKPKAQSSRKPSRTHKERSDGRNNSRPKEGGEGGGGGDIEFGFDNKRPAPNGNGVKPNGNREGRGHVVFENINGEVRHHGDHHEGGPRANHE